VFGRIEPLHLSVTDLAEPYVARLVGAATSGLVDRDHPLSASTHPPHPPPPERGAPRKHKPAMTVKRSAELALRERLQSLGVSLDDDARAEHLRRYTRPREYQKL
jgi:hypothetical protein